VIGHRALEPALEHPVKYFRQDIVTSAVDIYQDGEFYPWAGEDLTKLERLAAWEAAHVESRLRNHFAGKPDPIVDSLKYRAPKKV
jgi:hypothetical protein